MDLSFLRPLYARPGPWASAHMDASHDTEEGRIAVGLRWRALRERLLKEGADVPTVDAIERVVRRHEPRPGPYGLSLFAAHGEVVLGEYLPAPPPADLASFAPLPHVMPLVAQRNEEVAWVRALVSRTGADLQGLSAGRVPWRKTARGGATYPIRRVKAGGWRQHEQQDAAEGVWKHNADDASVAIVQLAERIGAEVVLVAGDVRATKLVAEKLPECWQERTVQTEVGQRAAGTDAHHLDEVTLRVITEVVERRETTALDQYGAQEGAGSGLAALISGIQRGQIDTGLLVHDPEDSSTLWIGPEPTQLAPDAGQLRDMGVDNPQEVRADAALVRGLSGINANLILLGPDEVELDEGAGAVLRYADVTTPGRRHG